MGPGRSLGIRGSFGFRGSELLGSFSSFLQLLAKTDTMVWKGRWILAWGSLRSMWFADRGQCDLRLVEVGSDFLQVWLRGVAACLVVDWFPIVGSGVGLVSRSDPV